LKELEEALARSRKELQNLDITLEWSQMKIKEGVNLQV
jgi:hypothetical protein